MVPYIRGGMPRKLAGTATTTLTEYPLNLYGGVGNYLVLRNTDGTNSLLFSLDKTDADRGDLWTLVKGEEIAWPAEYGSIWLKASALTTTWEAMVFIRRG